MGSAEDLEKMQARQSYRNVWHTDLTHSITADVSCFCLSIWCPPCTSYLLRKRALYEDMSRYICCAGYVPCSGKCGESKCPEFCLATEIRTYVPPYCCEQWCLLRPLIFRIEFSAALSAVFLSFFSSFGIFCEDCCGVLCCFANSVQSTRFLLQDEFNIQTTPCDNCIIGFMFCLQQIACIFSIIAMIVGSDEINMASQLLSCLANGVYCTVCACMQTQHKVEMDKRDGKFGPPPVQPMHAPYPQAMSRIDQAVPPTIGYAPYPPPVYDQPPPYGQPAYGYPPQSYPPPGYPPANHS